MIWLRMEASREATGSSRTINREWVTRGPGQGDALPLPAAELVGVEPGEGPVQIDVFQDLRDPLADRLLAAAPLFTSRGSPTMSPTRILGLRELWGSWKTACTVLR